MLEKLILKVMPPQKNIPISNLHHACAQKSGEPINGDEFKKALLSLATQKLVELTGTTVKRRETDFKELKLYKPLNGPLRSSHMLKQLKVLPENYIFEVTAFGGTQGLGQFTRPDLTMAAIRQQKYDPTKHLDVITFEVKNLAGANVMAVHETLAHARFSHYSYLVCPRSKLRSETTERLKLECTRYQVGLILFDLIEENEAPNIHKIDVEIQASRRQPDPDEVDEFIDRSFDKNKQAKLRKIAGLE